MMSIKWDIVAYDRDRHLILAAELKTKLGASSEWANRFLKNLGNDKGISLPKYFLLAFPDQFYLWKEISKPLKQIEPSYHIDARPIFQSYFKRFGIGINKIGIDVDKISHDSFELLLTSWLREIIDPDKIRDITTDESFKWFVESGLYKDMIGGSIECEVVV